MPLVGQGHDEEGQELRASPQATNTSISATTL
jgi:hypothetical protein